MIRSRPRGEQYLVRWAFTQLYDIDALSRMVDPSLHGAYPSKSLSRVADIISLCIQVAFIILVEFVTYEYLKLCPINTYDLNFSHDSLNRNSGHRCRRSCKSLYTSYRKIRGGIR